MLSEKQQEALMTRMMEDERVRCIMILNQYVDSYKGTEHTMKQFDDSINAFIAFMHDDR